MSTELSLSLAFATLKSSVDLTMSKPARAAIKILKFRLSITVETTRDFETITSYEEPYIVRDVAMDLLVDDWAKGNKDEFEIDANWCDELIHKRKMRVGIDIYLGQNDFLIDSMRNYFQKGEFIQHLEAELHPISINYVAIDLESVKEYLRCNTDKYC